MADARIFEEVNPDWVPLHEVIGTSADEWYDDYDLPDELDERYVGCEYCGEMDKPLRHDPFGGQGRECCDSCFNLLIGDDVDAPVWRCGTLAERRDPGVARPGDDRSGERREAA